MTKKEINRKLWGFGADSYNRFQTFLSIAPQLKGENYWYALRIAYESSDNLYNLRGLVKAAFCKNESNRHSLMSKREMNVLQSLPNRIIIYRGMTDLEGKSGN